AAQREAAHRRDPRLARAFDEATGPPGERVVAIEVGSPFRCHLLDVRARREGLVPGAGHDRAALRLVRFESGKGCDQILENHAAQRVERRGPVQRNERDRTALLDEDRRVLAHTTPKASIASATFLKPAILAPFT